MYSLRLHPDGEVLVIGLYKSEYLGRVINRMAVGIYRTKRWLVKKNRLEGLSPHSWFFYEQVDKFRESDLELRLTQVWSKATGWLEPAHLSGGFREFFERRVEQISTDNLPNLVPDSFNIPDSVSWDVAWLKLVAEMRTRGEVTTSVFDYFNRPQPFGGKVKISPVKSLVGRPGERGKG
jgi:hypothetical protein